MEGNYAVHSYVPGGSQTVANATPLATAAMPDISQFLALKLREKNARIKAMERPAPTPQYTAPMQANAMEQAPQQAPPQQNGGYVPTYVKYITGGPGIQAGYQKANRGDPGAVASGYIPRDEVAMNSGPANAQLVSAPTSPGAIQEKGFQPQVADSHDPYSVAGRARNYAYQVYKGGREVM